MESLLEIFLLTKLEKVYLLASEAFFLARCDGNFGHHSTLTADVYPKIVRN